MMFNLGRRKVCSASDLESTCLEKKFKKNRHVSSDPHVVDLIQQCVEVDVVVGL